MTCDVSRQSSLSRTPSPCFSCVWRRGLSTAAASSRPSPPRRSDHLIISKPGVTPVTCLPRDCASGASCFFCSAGQPAHHRARLHRLQEQDVATRVVAIACRRACIHRFVRSVALALCVCLHLAIVIRVLLRLSHASSIACKNTLCVLPVFDLYTALARVCSQALLNPRPKLQLRLAQRVAPGAGDSVSHLSFTSASGSGSSSSTVLAWNFENI